MDNHGLRAFRELPLTNIIGNRELNGYKYTSADQSIDAWTLTTDYKIFKNDTFKEVSNEPELVLDATLGESESFQIALDVGEKHNNNELVLTATDLTNTNSSVDKKNIRINRTGYVKTTTVSDSYGFLGDWPDPLLPVNSVIVKTGEKCPAWVTVKIPETTTPGIYNGSIDVKKEGMTVIKIPFKVRVHSFQLPTRFSQSFLAPDPGILRKNYKMDTSFGFRCLGKLVDGKVTVPEFETNSFKEKINLAKRIKPRYINMTHFHVGDGPHQEDFLGYKPGTPEYFHRIREYLQLVYNKFKEYGLHKNLRFYIYDEPTLQEIPLIKKIGRIVRSIDPDIFIWGAIYINCWNNMDGETRNLVDGWWMGYKNYTPEFLQWATKNNKVLMAGFNCGTRYPYPSLFIDAPALNPRVISWVNWKYNIRIITTWHTCHTKHSKDPYINPATFTNYNGDGVLIYPSGPNKKKPWNVPSIRLEMLREGMEDYEYLLLLKKLTEEASESQVKKEGIMLLKESESMITDAKNFKRDPSEYRKLKSRIANVIDKLKSQLQKSE